LIEIINVKNPPDYILQKEHLMPTAHWCTIAPIQPRWATTYSLKLPFDFSDGVTLTSLPAWFRHEEILDMLDISYRVRLMHHTRFALIKEYESNDSSVVFEGNVPTSDQARACHLMWLINIALWLAQPSGFGFEFIAQAKKENDGWTLIARDTARPLLPLNSYRDTKLTRDDIEVAKQICSAYASIPGQPGSGVIWTATYALRQALIEQTWQIRYTLIWIALEGLFGSADTRETVFRLCQRIAFFLA
jgi:hypothetical protein